MGCYGKRDRGIQGCVGLRRAHGRPQHLQRHRMKGLVHGRREDAVAVVYEEPIGGVQRETVPKLLYRPSGRRVCGAIPVHHAARRDVGETVRPSLRRSSAAMRSSPHVRLAVVISAMSCRSSTGIRGRPRGRDFACQKRRHRFRCHRTSVSGRTIVSSSRQATNRDSRTSATRDALSAPLVGPCVRRIRRAASAGTSSRPRVARGIGRSIEAAATGQQSRQAPFGARAGIMSSRADRLGKTGRTRESDF
jgi:hypothetical protein